MKNQIIQARRGLTLTEMMITLVVVGLVMAGMMPFLVFTNQYAFATSEELKFNHHIRQLTTRMHRDAREAAYFTIYSSFAPESRSDEADRLDIGFSGQAIVFVVTETDRATEPSHDTISRIVGYFVDVDNPNDDGTADVKRWEIEPSAGETWYANPGIEPANYSPPGSVNPSSQYQSLEDYFESVDEIHESLITVARIRESELGLFQNRNRTVTMTGSTLFGNGCSSISQTFHISMTSEG